METHAIVSQLQQWREELYDLLSARRDALLDLLDALCSSPHAHSVIEVSLSPLFRREYSNSSITDAIDNFFQASAPDRAAEEPRLGEATDPAARKVSACSQTAQVLALRHGRRLPVPPFRPDPGRPLVYLPAEPSSGQQTGDYRARLLRPGLAAGKTHPNDPPWVLPLLTRRVQSTEKATAVGVEQLEMLLGDDQQPFHNQLSLHVADSTYSAVEYLGHAVRHRNLVTVVRVPEKRVFRRGKSPGRVKGTRREPRPRQPVVKKGQKSRRQAAVTS